MGMLYPAYQWVLVSRRLDDFIGEIAMLPNNGEYTYDGKVYNCSTDVVLNASRILKPNVFLELQIDAS